MFSPLRLNFKCRNYFNFFQPQIYTDKLRYKKDFKKLFLSALALSELIRVNLWLKKLL